MYLRYLVKMKHHISYFYNAFIKYGENKLVVTRYVQNDCHCLEHWHTSVLATGQLHHQSVTARSHATHAHMQQMLSPLISAISSGLIHMLLNERPNGVIHWIGV